MKNTKPPRTLLEKARAVSRKETIADHITPELMELSLAWMRGEVTYSQAREALQSNSNIYNVLAVGLRQAYRVGQIDMATRAVQE